MTLARLSFSRIENPGLTLVVGAEVGVVDWIFDAIFPVGTSVSPIVAYFVTAHNDVFSLKNDGSHSLDLSVSQVTSGPNSILYSAQIKPLSATTILVAAGTVFGEVIVWICYRTTLEVTGGEEKWRSKVCNIFHGHNGSIFGVCLSEPVTLEHGSPRRLLASCSDDRTIRIWDVSDCDHLPDSALDMRGHDLETVRKTISASDHQPSIAATWGHISRIWGVEFMYRNGRSPTDSLHLISRGEDATCQVWALAMEESGLSAAQSDLGPGHLKFTNLGIDNYHAGKHIWSLAQFAEESHPLILTGGGDGGIITRPVPMQKVGRFESKIETSIRVIFESLVPQLPNDNDMIKQYVFVSSDTILAITNAGRLMKGVLNMNEEKRYQLSSATWVLLFHAPEFKDFCVMSSDISQEVVYLGSVTGNIWIYQHALASFHHLTTVDQRISKLFIRAPPTSSAEDTAHYVFVHSHDTVTAKVLQVTHLNREQNGVRVSRTVQLSLPATFQPTAFLHISHGHQLVIGSRSGALAIYQDVLVQREMVGEIASALCIRHVHGSESVTDLQHLPTSRNPTQDSNYWDIVSTGRDGSFAIHRIVLSKHDAPLLTTLHQSCLPFGPNIEGVNVRTNKSFDAELVFHGFDGKDFVVWNESSNSEVMKVTCGGPHRSWAYITNSSSLQAEKYPLGGQFLWTKARVLNMVKFHKPTHDIIQAGGHGREIKAIALHDESFDHVAPKKTRARLVATGAEDTTIRLWNVCVTEDQTAASLQSLDAKDSATCVRIINKHTTGIQHLAFCKDFLFSSGGFEELYIWKISFGVSGIGLGTVFQAALPKTAPVSDLRITSFEVACFSGERQAHSVSEVVQFVIYAAYSNSMVRIFRYTNDGGLSSGERFHLLARGFYNTNCLTNLCRLPGPPHWFLTTSTNGAVAAWPEINYHTDKQVNISCVTEHHIHQNAILALRITPLRPQYYLLVTGGDDNALGITMIANTSSPASQTENNLAPSFATLLIPKAHAAAITALEILDSRIQADLTTFTIVSTSCDQRVKMWHVTVNRDELVRINSRADSFGPRIVSAIDVQQLKAMWTNVADVSNVLVIPNVQNHHRSDTTDAGERKEPVSVSDVRRDKRLMVAGIGMEMFRIGAIGKDEEREGTGHALEHIAGSSSYADRR